MKLDSFVSDKFWEKIVKKKINSIPKKLFQALNILYKGNWDIDEKKIIRNLKSNYGYQRTGYFNASFPYEYFYIPLIVKLGDVTISNGKNTQLITDLYVELRLSENKGNIKELNLNGTRTSATLEELKSDYFHSHLSGVYKAFGSFCLGSNYEIYNSFKVVRDRMKPIEEYLLMLFTIKQSLSWESKSGVPYRYLENIGKEPLQQEIPNYISRDILKKLYLNTLKFKITDNSIQVVKTKDLEEQIFNFIKNKIYSEYTCYKNEAGEYIDTSHSTFNNDDVIIQRWKNRDMFVFKGEMLKFKINNLINIKNDTENNAPNPQLTNRIIKELSGRITKAHIANNRIKREDSIKNTQEYSNSDTIPVL